MARYPWIRQNHREKLVEARTILASLIDGPLPGVDRSIDTIQRNSDEFYIITDIIAEIEELLGY